MHVVERDRCCGLADSGDCLGDSFRGRPIRADDERGRDVRVAAETDELGEMRFLVRAVLSSAVGRGEHDRACDAALDAFRGPGNEAVDAEHEHVVAHAVAVVGTAVPRERDWRAIRHLPSSAALAPVLC